MNKRLILTLISGTCDEELLTRVSARVSSLGFTINTVSQIANEPELICYEFSIFGSHNKQPLLNKELKQLASHSDFDLVLQDDDVNRCNRKLAVFDMDSTLIQAEVIDLLADAAGVGEQVAAITGRAMQGELDFDQSFRERLAMLRGLDESVLAGIAEQLPLMDGAEKLITILKNNGYRTAILSGGFTYFARFLKQKLDIDYIYANALEIIDGKVTGKVSGEIINGQRKAELLQAIAAAENLSTDQVIAVGDGANDLPMLSVAGLGLAFRAKPLVRDKARHSISAGGLDCIRYLVGLR